MKDFHAASRRLVALPRTLRYDLLPDRLGGPHGVRP